jgi:hypothetical protein
MIINMIDNVNTKTKHDTKSSIIQYFVWIFVDVVFNLTRLLQTACSF